MPVDRINKPRPRRTAAAETEPDPTASASSPAAPAPGRVTLVIGTGTGSTPPSSPAPATAEEDEELDVSPEDEEDEEGDQRGDHDEDDESEVVSSGGAPDPDTIAREAFARECDLLIKAANELSKLDRAAYSLEPPAKLAKLRTDLRNAKQHPLCFSVQEASLDAALEALYERDDEAQLDEICRYDHRDLLPSKLLVDVMSTEDLFELQARLNKALSQIKLHFRPRTRQAALDILSNVDRAIADHTHEPPRRTPVPVAPEPSMVVSGSLIDTNKMPAVAPPPSAAAAPAPAGPFPPRPTPPATPRRTPPPPLPPTAATARPTDATQQFPAIKFDQELPERPVTRADVAPKWRDKAGAVVQTKAKAAAKGIRSGGISSNFAAISIAILGVVGFLMLRHYLVKGVASTVTAPVATAPAPTVSPPVPNPPPAATPAPAAAPVPAPPAPTVAPAPTTPAPATAPPVTTEPAPSTEAPTEVADEEEARPSNRTCLTRGPNLVAGKCCIPMRHHVHDARHFRPDPNYTGTGEIRCGDADHPGVDNGDGTFNYRSCAWCE